MKRKKILEKMNPFLKEKGLEIPVDENIPANNLGFELISFCASNFKVGTMEEEWHPEITLGDVISIIEKKTI